MSLSKNRFIASFTIYSLLMWCAALSFLVFIYLLFSLISSFLDKLKLLEFIFFVVFFLSSLVFRLFFVASSFLLFLHHCSSVGFRWAKKERHTTRRDNDELSTLVTRKEAPRTMSFSFFLRFIHLRLFTENRIKNFEFDEWKANCEWMSQCLSPATLSCVWRRRKEKKTVIDSESSRASEKICSINKKKESGNPMNRQKPESDRSIWIFWLNSLNSQSYLISMCPHATYLPTWMALNVSILFCVMHHTCQNRRINDSIRGKKMKLEIVIKSVASLPLFPTDISSFVPMLFFFSCVYPSS